MTEPLDPKHSDYLTRRAVTSSIAQDVGLRSVSESEAATLISFSKPLKCRSLAIPYFDEKRVLTLYRVRPDEPGDGPKFLAPADTPVLPYLPPPPLVPLDAWADTNIEIVFVEGPIKALALCGVGELAIGLGGVSAGGHDADRWRTKRELRVHPDLDRRVALKGRKVLIVYDAGRASNPQVALGEARLAGALRSAGAIVSVASLPFGEDGCDQGPDDFVAKRGKDAFALLRQQAVPADPIERVRSIAGMKTREARVDAARVLLLDLPFIAAVHFGGKSIADMVAAELRRAADVGKRALQERLDAFQDALHGKAVHADGETTTVAEAQYKTVDGRLCHLRDDGSGAAHPIPLCNFDSRIVEQVAYDDGAEITRTFKIETRLGDGTVMPTAIVAASEFAAMHWVSRDCGAQAVIAAGHSTKDRMREAIQILSSPTGRTVYRHSGWRDVGGERVFLHAGGAVGAEGVAVELDPPHDRMVLPREPENLKDAVAWSMRILELGPPTVMVPLLASTYLAPLSGWLAPDFVVWLVGQSGSMKSTIAALGQGHYGSFDRLHLPANWTFTDNAIEAVLHRYKDVLCVVDDYAPAADHRSQVEVERRAQRIVRNVGNQAARGRLRADLRQRPDRPPRGVVVATGEDVPPGASILARLVVVDVPKGSVDLDRLTQLQENGSRLPHAMRGYVDWLRTKPSSFPDALFKRRQTLRAELSTDGAHLRQSDALATLALGFEALLGFARSVGVLDQAQFDERRSLGIAALRTVGEQQSQLQHQVSPAHRFVEELSAMLAQGRVELVPRDKPLDPTARGATPVYSRTPIGWRDDQHAYCEPALTRRVVTAAIRQSGEAWSYSDHALTRDLVAEGFMVPGGDGHNSAHVRVGGEVQPRRVLRIRLEHLGSAAPIPGSAEHGDAYEAE